MKWQASNNSLTRGTAASATLPQLWTKNTLTKEDYEFAISKNPKDWECMATELCKTKALSVRYLAVEMYWWEIWREVLDSKPFDTGSVIGHYDARPFLAVAENRQRVETVLRNSIAPETNPANLPPLEELSLEKAAEFESFLKKATIDSQFKSRLIFETLSVHAFRVCRLERTDQVVQRFRNWLVKNRQEHKRPAWLTCAAKSDLRFKEGNIHIDRLLMALAVHRLKQAGFMREEAEEKLNLKRYHLAGYLLTRSKNFNASQGAQTTKTDYWSKMPRLVAREITRLAATKGQAFGYEPPFAFISEKNCLELGGRG